MAHGSPDLCASFLLLFGCGATVTTDGEDEVLRAVGNDVLALLLAAFEGGKLEFTLGAALPHDQAVTEN